MFGDGFERLAEEDRHLQTLPPRAEITLLLHRLRIYPPKIATLEGDIEVIDQEIGKLQKRRHDLVDEVGQCDPQPGLEA